MAWYYLYNIRRGTYRLCRFQATSGLRPLKYSSKFTLQTPIETEKRFPTKQSSIRRSRVIFRPTIEVELTKPTVFRFVFFPPAAIV